ncbi:MAG TPA: DNA-binding response regulator [Proteiniclasticum sp.]|uniref:response regulator transcription factor n=1 Tax=Proteiniclasticum sp. TaxID=2053595 RepID=UPI000E9A8851|nr:response regulator [Proteiniclasticum sp.]HBW13636.1 DNA-binding response regulator [Proteiniclasticum sp.]
MYKLLICDDEAIIRNGLKSIIEKTSADFDIIGLASNGFEAHEMILFEEPDLVLMDINMPGMTGLEIMENVQTQGIHSKFIIISGYDEFQYAQKAVKLRALDYILKPIDREKLLQSLETALHDLIKEHHAKKEETLSADENLEKKALQLLYRNYGNSDFSLQSLADLLHISTSSLSRMLKKETGLSFSEYLTKIRMESSMCLLKNQKELSVLEISERAGYKNQHYFCKVFRQYTGKTPSEYRHSTMM